MSFPLLLLAALSVAPASADLRVVAHYPVPGDVRFDYLRADAGPRRLYVSHGNKVEVLDLDTGALVGAVAPMKGVHGIALVPALGKGYITSGQDRTVVVFSTATLQIAKVITGLGVKPDAVEYDPATKRIYVANGESGGITVIDPATDMIVATVPLVGKLEGLAFDGQGRLFVNTEDKSEIQVVDTGTLKAVATWPIAPVEGGTGLTIDRASHRLFSAGGNGMLAVVDSDSGKVVATPAIGEDPDGDAFDAERGLVFTSSVSGTVSVLHEDTPDAYRLVQTVTTAPGARTCTLDSQTGRLLVMTGKFDPTPPATAENPHPRKRGIPGTFEVLVVGR
jgi:YVTN family beta-propeller protein